MENLLISIARCNEIEKAQFDVQHACHKIVSVQKSSPFQLPEPWNGNLSKSDVLFIASNPSYNSSEFFPNPEWDDSCIECFFQNRFSNSYYQKIRYWSLIKKYASWILGVAKDDPNLPARICITEIVHCKSTRETGVKKASCICSKKWLDRILKAFNGSYVVVLGKVAQELFPKDFDDKSKKVLNMPHPNARGVTDAQRKQALQIM